MNSDRACPLQWPIIIFCVIDLWIVIKYSFVSKHNDCVNAEMTGKKLLAIVIEAWNLVASKP